MSTRNLIWLIVVIAVGAAGWFLGGWIIGLIAGIATLVISEVVERRARRQRIATAQRAN